MNVEHLVVRLQEEPALAQWAVFDEGGRVVRQMQSGPLSGAAAAATGRRVVVLVPGVEIVLTETTLPKANPARLRKMLPFSLEDALAEDVEQLVFAVGPRLESGAVAVAVVARRHLAGWLEQLAAAGLSPQAVYSDAEGVPDTPSTLSLIIEDRRVYGRAPGRPPFVFEGLSLEQILEVVDGAGELRHAVVYVDEAGRGRHTDALRGLGDRIASTQVKLMGDGALYRLAATLTAQPGTNLLQGEYAPKSNVAAMVRPWRAAAGLLVGLVLVSVAVQAAEYLTLRQQNRALTEQLTETCAEELSAPLDVCERTVRTRLSQSGLLPGGDSFLMFLATVAEARAPDSRISALEYRNQTMTLQLTVGDIPALDAFIREVEGSELFDASIQSSSNTGDGRVEGRVQLVETGAR